MRLFLPIGFIILLSVSSLTPSVGQRTKRAVYSASSDWQKVAFRPTSRLQTNPTLSSTNGSVRQPVTQPSLPTEPATSTNPIGSSTPPATETNSVSPPHARPALADAAPAQPSRTAPSTAARAGYRPAFTGDFATNRNNWKAGVKGDYHYQIGMGRYSIRKRKAGTQQVAFSFVPLPADINLNVADTFTVKVDVMADSGRIPTGGLLFGVADSLNFCAFTMNSKGEASIIRVANGETFGDYMPGDFFAPGVTVDKNRNRLTVRRRRDALHFYINEQEIRSSPYPFKVFSGNGIGMITSAYWTSFQKLSVILGP